MQGAKLQLAPRLGILDTIRLLHVAQDGSYIIHEQLALHTEQEQGRRQPDTNVQLATDPAQLLDLCYAACLDGHPGCFLGFCSDTAPAVVTDTMV